MNILITILLGFSLLGLLDKILGGKLGLVHSFDTGFGSIASLSLSVIGIYCVGITIVQNASEQIQTLASYLPFDVSLLIASILGPDMGGYSISKEIAQTPLLRVFSGVMVSSSLGATTSFILPIALGSIRQKDTVDFMLGIVRGIATVPLCVLTGGLLIGLPFSTLCKNLFPIILLCLILCIALLKAEKITIGVLSVFGNCIRIISLILFAIVIIGLYFPQCKFVPDTLFWESLVIVLQVAIIISGSMVASSLILKFFRRPMISLGKKLGMNEFSIIGLLMNLASSISMLPLLEQMDKRGKIANAAFAVSGGFALGGQLAFISSVEPTQVVTAFIIAKFVGGLSAIAITMLTVKTSQTS